MRFRVYCSGKPCYLGEAWYDDLRAAHTLKEAHEEVNRDNSEAHRVTVEDTLNAQTGTNTNGGPVHA